MGDARRLRAGPLTRRWSLSLAGVYFLLGVSNATWFSRIPAVQATLGLGSGTLGLALLGLPVGSIAAALMMPRLLRRWGTRRPVRWTVPLSAAALAALPLAHQAGTLFAGLLLFGITTGALDVAMNANGLALQDRVGRSVFGRLHAAWSLGGFTGAGIGALLTRADIGVGLSLPATAAAVAVLGLVVAGRLQEPAGETPRDRARTAWSADPTIVVLAVVALAAFAVEVTAADWGGVFLHRVVHAGAGAAAAAFAGFALPHFLIRAFGDPIVDRVGRRGILGVALAIAAVGFLVVVTSQTAAVGLAGLALAGAGIGLVVPVAFGAAGSVPAVLPGSGLATVAGVAYVGWTATPPAIGGLAAAAGLRVALLLPVGLAVAAAVAVTVRRSV